MKSKPSNKTIRDIAELAGVSLMTVSRVINNSPLVRESTREKVMAIIAEQKFKVNITARSLVSQKTYTIGVFFSTIEHKVSDSFTMQCLREIYNTLAPGYNMVVKDFSQGLYEYNPSRTDGIIFISMQESDDEFISLIQQENPKIVVINRRTSIPNIINITIDEEAGAKAAVELLIRKGYKNIGLINGQPNIQANIDRANGYYQALQEARMPVNAARIYNGSFNFEGGYLMMTRLLQNTPDVDAVFCANDEIAVGALKALEERGLKGKIAIVGFNDSEIGRYTTPPLTTVHKPVDEMARQGCKALFDLINGKEHSELRHILPTELVIRKSAMKKVD